MLLFAATNHFLGAITTMRAIILQLTLVLMTCSSVVVGKPTTFTAPSLLPTPPSIAANAYLLVDFNSGQVVAENNSDLSVEPASLTKMMTMYIIDNEIKAGKLKLDDQILVSNNAWQASGSRMFLNVNSRVSVEELIKGIIIQSGNDASVAMAEHIAGSEQSFADLMNRYAQMLGMNNSHFENATGLPNANHVTTARDMAILAKALIKNFPETYKIYAQKEFVFNGIRQYNRNQLLWRNGSVDGIKTGHTDNAGFCLVASAKSPRDMRLIAIIMGAKSEKARTEEANKLLTWGFRFYETNLVHQAAVKVQDAKIWMGADRTLDVGFEDDLYVTAPQGNFKQYTTSVNLIGMIKAPITQGDVVGTYVVQDENAKIILEQPIVALKTIRKGNVFQRGFDFVKLNIDSIVNKFRT